MKKQRKWQFLLILAVIAVTIYNILPTIFYYSKPLRQPVTEAKAEQIAYSIERRSLELENDTKEWLHSYCNLLQIKPTAVSISPENLQLVTVSFVKLEEARRLRSHLPRAGSLIPFAPAQLSLAAQDEHNKDVLVQRNVPFRLQKDWFSYAPKNDPAILADRIRQVLSSLSQADSSHSLEQKNLPLPVIESLATQINAIAAVFGDDSSIAARYAARLLPNSTSKPASVQTLLESFDQARDQLKLEKGSLSSHKESNLLHAEAYLKKHSTWFSAGQKTIDWNSSSLVPFHKSFKEFDPSFPAQRCAQVLDPIDLTKSNPLFASLSFDPVKNQLFLSYRPEVLSFKASGKNRELFEQLLIDEAAKIGRLTNEQLSPGDLGITISLHHLDNLSGYLVLDQKKVAVSYVEHLKSHLAALWHPKHPDLQNIAIVDLETFRNLPLADQALCIVITSPLATDESLTGLKPDGLYVVAKGMDRILKTYEAFPHSDLAGSFTTDLRSLANLLHRNSFFGYPGSSLPGGVVQEGDFLFEKLGSNNALLLSSRENFVSHGSQKYSLLELSDCEERILTENQIDTQIHSDLLKWKDDYFATRVSLDPNVRFDVPKPTKSIFWHNLLLSAKKYVRGDDRKIIRWGLDLSGGKTVQIELRDAHHKSVKNEADLKQGIKELYNRVNKLGVSEVSIRQLGNHIVLDFPGSQALSANDLIKASTMSFHLVNEQFSLGNPSLADPVNRFLQEVWNEASVTGRKDSESVNAIAVKHLHTAHQDLRSEAAQILWDQGLRLESDESVSRIALFRGDASSEWHGQSHPLLVVFASSALEGNSLANIRSGYDPSKGNFLSFEVAGASAKDTLFSWASRYCKENIQGTALETYTRGRGWRMAAILNNEVISSPSLEAPLRDSAMISGSFSQREVSQLTNDLKAGSLTFTPHILLEKNVSPELGKTDRMKGIIAMLVACLLVVGSMVTYYRFAGVVASIAVLFNLLILWATLQNLGAALTLAGLAGVVLTVGMAVDANVLVFERIKEEFALTGRISSAIAAGYQKAYSAIIDSNITTIIAALILLNFDAGPIKSFAINLIIGIASSMFTALFMTRFYFNGWVQNPKNTILKMADWIRSTHFDFLKWAPVSFSAAIAIILAGGSLIFINRSSLFGMDFTGGYALNLELQAGDLQGVKKALLSSGIASTDFQIQELDQKTNLRLLLGTTMEQVGKPFHGMPIELQSDSTYLFQKNPRIAWTVDTLQNHGISLSPAALPELHTNWTAMSGQMSDTMRNNALLGLLISFICIFIYLSFRFEYKFAAAALICLFHDVLITLGAIGILHLFGLKIQIDLNTIAALMTIIGYSLNDTIIIFDRIREEMEGSGKQSLPILINRALNATLSRTTITSGTTLLVLIALVAIGGWGGGSIFSFGLVMAIGVFFGTLSSWFIAAPLMIFFHAREQTKPVLLK